VYFASDLILDTCIVATICVVKEDFIWPEDLAQIKIKKACDENNHV
jgi:hypothetical protein